mmetsp:Transcript_104158/g.334098  ORF Transcript_104158/g.334098 Transcript_104158/m.334098 type:complete len:250 (-) Transcript_104158:1846-2595(-)
MGVRRRPHSARGGRAPQGSHPLGRGLRAPGGRGERARYLAKGAVADGRGVPGGGSPGLRGSLRLGQGSVPRLRAAVCRARARHPASLGVVRHLGIQRHRRSCPHRRRGGLIAGAGEGRGGIWWPLDSAPRAGEAAEAAEHARFPARPEERGGDAGGGGVGIGGSIDAVVRSQAHPAQGALLHATAGKATLGEMCRRSRFFESGVLRLSGGGARHMRARVRGFTARVWRRSFVRLTCQLFDKLVGQSERQ